MRLRSLALLFSLSSTVLLAAGLPARAAYTPSAQGSGIGVATDDARATRAAVEVLRAGGNAFDGAIAAALTLGVVNPGASGLGGGGFALVYSAHDHKVVALDFREVAPAGIVAKDLFDHGKRGASVGVPGEPAGLEWLSVHYAKRSLAQDAMPAARLARAGFPIGRHLADEIAFTRRYLDGTPLAPILYPGGNALGYRHVWRRAALARTIARFGAQGSRPFYHGDIAAKIVASADAEGDSLTAADLSGYRVRERAPLTRTLGSRVVYAMPPPSAGGLMTMEALAMYGADSTSPLRAMGFGSSLYLHTLAEVMRGAVADRARNLADPDFQPAVTTAVQHALDPAQLAARRKRILPGSTHQAADFKTKEQGTTHLVVADAEGNVVSLTTTVNGPFGARIFAGDTGVLLNNELYDFSKPQDVAAFGVAAPGPNAPRGRARPVSSMTPTIVLENGAPILALGGSGGWRIASNVMQAAVARLVFGLDPSACVSSPRVFTKGPELFVDPEIAEDVREGLRKRGEKVQQERFLGTAVQMVAWDRSGGAVKVLAASDPRKLGFAAAQ